MSKSINQALLDAGIEIIRTGRSDARGNVVYLRYAGKEIRRPSASVIDVVVLREFGITLC